MSVSKILLLRLHVEKPLRVWAHATLQRKVLVWRKTTETLSEERPACFGIDPLQSTAELGDSQKPATTSGRHVKYRQWVFLKARSIGTTLSRCTDTVFSLKKLKMKMRVSLLYVVYFLREICTWNLRMSRGLPAFFKQFWLHLRKNFRKNL